MSGAFSYAQARLQARHAARPRAALWIRLEASRSLAHFLESARASALEPWLSGLGNACEIHEIEPGLRRAFRKYVLEVAAWLPERWQPSIAWTAELIELPTRPDQQVALEAWQLRFRELMPRTTATERRGLEALAELVARHRARLLEAERTPSDADGWQLDRAFERALVRLFRRQSEQPAAALCHLALIALDLERLRAALVSRALFAIGERTG